MFDFDEATLIGTVRAEVLYARGSGQPVPEELSIQLAVADVLLMSDHWMFGPATNAAIAEMLPTLDFEAIARARIAAEKAGQTH